MTGSPDLDARLHNALTLTRDAALAHLAARSNLLDLVGPGYRLGGPFDQRLTAQLEELAPYKVNVPTCFADELMAHAYRWLFALAYGNDTPEEQDVDVPTRLLPVVDRAALLTLCAGSAVFSPLLELRQALTWAHTRPRGQKDDDQLMWAVVACRKALRALANP
jgi:hypothetical protein